jgi:hypothetical protein
MPVPVVLVGSLQEATETVRELVLALQVRHNPSSIPSWLNVTENSQRRLMPINGTRGQNQTINSRPNLHSSALKRA